MTNSSLMITVSKIIAVALHGLPAGRAWRRGLTAEMVPEASGCGRWQRFSGGGRSQVAAPVENQPSGFLRARLPEIPIYRPGSSLLGPDVV